MLFFSQIIQFLVVRVNIYLYFLAIIFVLICGFYFGIKHLYDKYQASRFRTRLFRYLKQKRTRKMKYDTKPNEMTELITMNQPNKLENKDPLKTHLTESLINQNIQNKEKPNSEIELELCLICHDDIETDQLVIDIPKCNHMMHEECLLHWLRENPSCPLCRSQIVVPDSF
jgi:hypothetical protein